MLLRSALLAGLVLGLMLACVSLAPAHDNAVDTRVTIREIHSGTEYGGRVISKLDACVRHRTIQFWRRTSGPDDLIDTFPADADGKWHFEFVGDHYYAIAKRAVVGGAGHHHVCRSDQSRTV